MKLAFWSILASVSLVFWYHMFVEFIAYQPKVDEERSPFELVIILGPFGALIYFIFVYLPRSFAADHPAVVQHRRIKELEKEVFDELRPGQLQELGNLYLNARKFKRALRCFNRLLDQENSVRTRLAIAVCQIRLGRAKEAAVIVRGIRLNDTSIPEYELHAICRGLIRAKEYEAALELIEPVAQNTLSFPIRYHYAVLLYLLRRRDKAREVAAGLRRLASETKRKFHNQMKVRRLLMDIECNWVN